jgi:hypothetical protein
MKKKIQTVPEILRSNAKTYEERNKLYGDNYKKFGQVVEVLFPEGLPCISADDHNRYGILVQCLSKLMRYAENLERGGHKDSAHDLSVYAAMLEELTDDHTA